jgi:acyl-CoA synthetase (AMP-forming)/AMP-acid ligase II
MPFGIRERSCHHCRVPRFRLPAMHAIDMVFFWAKTDPHRAAIIQPEAITTYQGLADAIVSIGERIDRLGLSKQEPVALSIANPTFRIATSFALLRSGYSVASVNPPLFPHLYPSGIRSLVYDSEGQMLSGGKNIRFDVSWLPSAAPATARKPYQYRSIGDARTIFFTSGTTGIPKKVVKTPKSWEQRMLFSSSANFGDFDKVLIASGLWSSYGFTRCYEVLMRARPHVLRLAHNKCFGLCRRSILI